MQSNQHGSRQHCIETIRPQCNGHGKHIMVLPKVCLFDLHPVLDGPTVTFQTFTSHEASPSRLPATKLVPARANSGCGTQLTPARQSEPAITLEAFTSHLRRQTSDQKSGSRRRIALANIGLGTQQNSSEKLCCAASRIPGKLMTVRVAWAWLYMICLANTRLLGSIPAAQNQG